jgi:hypothetical protein
MKPPKHGKLLEVMETAHIPLWLVKDVCWLMTYRTLGVVVAIPTILVAIIMAFITYGDKDRFLPNISIALWIIANANWMFAEFFEWDTRFLSLYPFVAGILVFAFFLGQKLFDKTDKIKHI